MLRVRKCGKINAKNPLLTIISDLTLENVRKNVIKQKNGDKTNFFIESIQILRPKHKPLPYHEVELNFI
jgi:hypothetical protein